MHRTKSVEKFLITIMTDLLTITIRTIAPDPDSTLSKPEKGDRGRLILCEGDGLNPLIAKLLSCLSPRQLFEFVRWHFCSPLSSPVQDALRLSETGFFTLGAGCNLCIFLKKPGFTGTMRQSYLHNAPNDPTFPTLRSDFSDLLYAEIPNILLNSIYQKT